ncbi:hypothetical protein Pcinc_001659 [Petrolisthes cinctipes]|uniref:ABC transporter domain-containing protein n=1 Tax=Petrolisthes cinctipes TaxID=88211 RepID=A0AAE1GKV5_PETCI|nr:hypothetical protein Pcinc_001659 [Petrolisthes cinctipes]
MSASPSSSPVAWGESSDQNSLHDKPPDTEENTASFSAQFKGLFIRNLIIKRRDKRKTVAEILVPLYWILILIILRLTIPDTVYPALTQPHGQALLLTSPLPLNSTTLHVTPNDTQVQAIMQWVQEKAKDYLVNYDVMYYPTENDLINRYQVDNVDMTVAVVFSDNPVDNKTYKLRYKPGYGFLPAATSLWSGGEGCRDNLTDGLSLQMVNCPSNGYYFSGFSSLQALIDTAIISLDTQITVPPPTVLLQNFPRDSYVSSGGETLRAIVPLYMVFAWAQFIVYMMMLVVGEKEKKIKESMKMMGLRDSVYWLSWFAIYGFYVLALATVCIILLPLAQVFKHANVFLLFLLFILYGCSSVVFSFMLTPFFNKARAAGIAANLVQVALSCLFYLQVYLGDDLDPAIFWALGLFSPCAFAFAVDKALLLDISGEGLNFDTVWNGPGLPFAGSLIMISIDLLLYFFLAFYLDNVVPSEYGTKRKPWFLFEKSFWVEKKTNLKFVSAGGVTNEAFEHNSPDVEPVSGLLKSKTAVRIRNLRKKFTPRGKDAITAVDDFSLDIYEGQITAILGHNGAGKTTLFNILTGMTAPTQGSASVFGLDISNPNDLRSLHRVTGVCPQHDVIFLTLTPTEHLEFFAQIRGVPAERIESEVEQTLKDVDLYSKKDTVASDLSGGQKRKLSIGIALIGDPKIIFLDEPTAGVDAYSRRKLWGLLKKKKEGKVILLTTHFMDEADILADRKTIMSKGKLRCCGSSLFLKNKFGLGYHLTLVVAENTTTDSIMGELKKTIQDVQLMRYFGKEMSFLLPVTSANHFTELFSQLDKHINNTEDNIGIEGYGISMTTLEEVFLTLSEENEENNVESINNLGKQLLKGKPRSASSPEHRAPSSSPPSSPSANSTLNGATVSEDIDTHGFSIEAVETKRDTWRIFKAMMIFRLIGAWREIAALIFLVLLPIGFLIGAIALSDTQSKPVSTSTLLNLVPDVYNKDMSALLANKTTHKLESIVSTFLAANMSVMQYPGYYSDLVNNSDHLTAFNVYNFPEVKSELTNVTVRFNDHHNHAIPILLNILNNAVLSALGGTGNISVATQFLPSLINNIQFDISSFFAPILIGYTFTLIPCGLTMDIVNERELKLRNILRQNGLGFNLYFSSYFIQMGSFYMLSYVAMLIVVQAFQVESLVVPAAFTALAILYLLFLPVALLFSAVTGYMFDRAETAREFYPSIATSLGFVTYTIVSLVDMLVTSNSNPALIIHIVFTIICPYYIPFGLLYYTNKIYIMCTITNTCGESGDYMTPEIIILFVVLLLDIPFYYLLLRVVDTVKMGGKWQEALWLKKPVGNSLDLSEDGLDSPRGEDDDVQQERKNVTAALSDPSSTSPVLIYNLGKTYQKGSEKNSCRKGGKEVEFVAVKSLSLEVKKGQVFGLLGPNGAGKTTTLRIMTAEENPTKGRVQICGDDVQSSMASVFETMGYCPQHDALWPNMTVSEHIRIYSEIRGVRKDQVKGLVDMYLKGLEIEEHRNKKTKNCSGGTKRKLSYILAMLGRPQVVLLDEPSTGMDPKSKRFLWNSILASFRGERSAILTTHSMEEADALCSNIGILVRGGMRCIGPVQHLKNKYGGGYSLEVKLSTMRDKTQALEMIHETFPNAVLDEQFEERLEYKIPQRDVKSLANCFAMLENAKTDGLLEEYALSQTTLEQVFLQFARQQEEQEEDEEEEEHNRNDSNVTTSERQHTV